MIFDNLFKRKKDSFVLPIDGMDSAIKKYPLNDFENNFFYGFRTKFPNWYIGMQFYRTSKGTIQISYRGYPIGGLTRKGILYIEKDLRYKDPFITFDDPLNHYDDIVSCIKRKLK